MSETLPASMGIPMDTDTKTPDRDQTQHSKSKLKRKRTRVLLFCRVMTVFASVKNGVKCPNYMIILRNLKSAKKGRTLDAIFLSVSHRVFALLPMKLISACK